MHNRFTITARAEREREYLQAAKAARPVTAVGMSQNEIRDYSIMRAIQHVGTDPQRKHEGLEFEVSDEIARKLGREASPGGIFVPQEIQARDLNVSVAGEGGHLVGNAPVPRSFVGALYARGIIYRMGAQRLTGLVGNVPVSKLSGTGTGYWLSAETTQVTPSDQTFVEIAMKPRIVGGYTNVSSQLLHQSSPAAEGIVMSDLGTVVARAVDFKALTGIGANGEPLGVVNVPGVGAWDGSSLTYDKLLAPQQGVLDANALLDPNSVGYVTTPTTARLLANRQRFTGTDATLWQGNLADGTLAGFPAMSSTGAPANISVFADWSTCLVGEWGILEIVSDPFTFFKTRVVGIRALFAIDVAWRYPAAASVSTTIS